MTLKTNKLRDAISFALVGSTAFLGMGTAFAQDAPSSDELDVVTVTGSRIPRSSEVEGISPVLTIDRAAIEATGLSSVGDILFNITASDGGALRNITTSTNGSDGTQNISLRGLGATRTLLLVNGRRWVTQGGGVVDLNTIPISVVERIEVLKDGASAIYGSDAIAGVVNVITRKNFDGAEANASIGAYTKGDGLQQSYDFTVGANNDRWNAVVGIAYQTQEPVFQGDREISSVPLFGGGDIASGGPFGSGSNANGNFVRCAGAYTTNPLTGFRTCATVAGGPFTLRNGEDGRQATDFRRFIGISTDNSGRTDRYNFAPVNYLLQPIDRFNIYGQASLRLTDRINANVTAVYVKRDSNQQLAEVPLTMNTTGANGPQWAFAPTAGSVFNPFGQNLRSANFRSIAIGPRKPYYDDDNLAVTLSLDGSFDLVGRDMYWDVGYSYLANRNTVRGENFVNLFNLRNAVGDSRRNPVTNALECLNGTTVIAGCVPYNIFGGPDLGLAAGVISQAEYDAMNRYISYTLNGFQENITKDYFANLSGSIVDLPAGPLGFAVGLEHRRTNYVNQPDALVAGGGSSNNFSEPTSGAVNSDEIYAELNVPILANIPGVKLLELNLAARKSDYESSGFFGGTDINPDLGGDTSGKIGLKWQVFDDLLFRGTYSESFRAPSVTDLYAGGGESFPQASDPCNPANINSVELVTGRRRVDRALCIAQGAPATGAVQPNAQIRSLNGGNPDLQPEFGTTKSFGMVYSPSWAPGLNFSLDWYNISLEDVISFRGSQAILNACYGRAPGTASPDDPGAVGAAADPAQRALFCSFVGRDATGQVINLRQSSFNLAEGEVEGYDFQVTYAMPETAWGKFSFQWDNTYVTENTLFGTVGEYNGSPNWRLRSNINTTWQKGDWDANWAVRYYSDMDDPCTGQNYFEYGYTPTEVCADSGENHISATFYHDVQVGWKAPWNAKITMGARNVFGKEPPITRNSFAGGFDGAYDLPEGGFFYMQYKQKF